MEETRIQNVCVTALKDGRFDVVVPYMSVDEQSQKLHERLSEKWYKGGKFRVKFVYTPSDEIHDAQSALKHFLGEISHGPKRLMKRGSGTEFHFADLTLKEDGYFHLEMTEAGASLLETDWVPNIRRGKKGKASDAEAVSCMGKVADPDSEQAKALIGQCVEISETYVFADPFPKERIATLNAIDPTSSFPFRGIRDDGTEISGSCVRLHVPTMKPVDLADKGARESLRGKWIINTVTEEEMMIGRFRKCDDGLWRANGKTADELFRDWRFDDGSEIGASI